MKNVIAKTLVTALAAVTVSAIMPNTAEAAVDQTKAVSDTSTHLMSGYIQPKVTITTSRPKNYKKVRKSPRKTPAASNIEQLDWSEYSSDYFYNNLADDKAKQFYSDLTKSASDFMNNNSTASTLSVPYPSELTTEQVENIFDIWKETEAQYFFVNNNYDINQWNHSLDIKIMADYQDGDKRQAARKLFLENINSILGKTESANTDFDKEKIIFDELIMRLRYDINVSSNAQSSSSSLIDHTTVCAGYSAAFSVLMNKAGIPTVSITSDGHEWNESLINNNWYNVDVTWGDPVDTEDGSLPNISDDNDACNISYEYFNSSDSDFKDDTSKNVYEHTPLSYWNEYSRPVCSKTLDKLSTNNYYYILNNYYDKDITYGDRLSDEYITDFLQKNFL